MRTAMYLRVSTRLQDVESQRYALRKWSTDNGLTDADFDSFEDEGVSGSKTSRPGWDALMGAVRAGAYKRLVVFSLDRASRWPRAEQFINWLVDMRGLGVEVISLSDPIVGFDTLPEQITAIVGAYMRDQERQRIGQRTKAGIARVRAQGTRWGRPKGSGRKWTDQDAKAARRAVAAGADMADVAKQIGVSTKTVSRMLRAS